MAWRRASLASAAVLRSSASMARLDAGAALSGSLHAGQRLAKPGLSGFSSNGSEQTTQTLIGKAIRLPVTKPVPTAGGALIDATKTHRRPRVAGAPESASGTVCGKEGNFLALEPAPGQG